MLLECLQDLGGIARGAQGLGGALLSPAALHDMSRKLASGDAGNVTAWKPESSAPESAFPNLL